MRPVLPRLNEVDLRNPEMHYRVQRLRDILAETVEWLNDALDDEPERS